MVEQKTENKTLPTCPKCSEDYGRWTLAGACEKCGEDFSDGEILECNEGSHYCQDCWQQQLDKSE